jgi:histidyl-tRNA synthetase
VVGSDSLLYEAEFLNIYQTVFEKLGIPKIEIRINNRKILSALAELIGKPESISDITIAIDKLDKIGLEKVCEELQNKGVENGAIEKIKNYLAIDGSEADKLIAITNLLNHTENGKAGIAELIKTLDYLKKVNANCNPILDFTLARGLDYYTGLIVEIKTTAVQMGSIGGGGRYDNLTGVFDYPNVSGMGISFGVDRLFDVMDELQLFPEALKTGIDIMFINFGDVCEEKCIDYVQQLRAENIACELYPDASKFDKQMKYANKRNYPFIAIVGEDEMKDNSITLKNFASGEQSKINIEQLITRLKK